MIEMRIYGIVPGEGPQVYNIAPSLIAEILDGCIPQSSTEFRDVYAAWMERYAPGAMPPEAWTPDRVTPEWAERFEPEGKLYFSRDSALIAMWYRDGIRVMPNVWGPGTWMGRGLSGHWMRRPAWRHTPRWGCRERGKKSRVYHKIFPVKALRRTPTKEIRLNAFSYLLLEEIRRVNRPAGSR